MPVGMAAAAALAVAGGGTVPGGLDVLLIVPVSPMPMEFLGELGCDSEFLVSDVRGGSTIPCCWKLDALDLSAMASETGSLRTYPLEGPLFKGTLSKEHVSLFLVQFVQGLTTLVEDESSAASHRTFFLRHSSHALDTLERLRCGTFSCGGGWVATVSEVCCSLAVGEIASAVEASMCAMDDILRGVNGPARYYRIEIPKAGYFVKFDFWGRFSHSHM